MKELFLALGFLAWTIFGFDNFLNAKLGWGILSGVGYIYLEQMTDFETYNGTPYILALCSDIYPLLHFAPLQDPIIAVSMGSCIIIC